MKKWLIWAAAALLASCGHKANYSGKDTYVIQGESSAFVDGQYMFVADATNWSYLDSAKIEGHAFYLESRNTGTGIAMLYMGENSASRSLQQISNYFFPETGYTDVILIVRDRQVFPNSSCPVGKVHFPFKNSGQSAKVSFTVQLQMKTGNA